MKTNQIAASSKPHIACLLVLTTTLWAACAAHAQTPTADSFNPQALGTVYALAVQPDGKVLVGGDSYLGRLNADGTLDTTFNPWPGGVASALAVQKDGKILVGGYFTTLGGQTRNYLGRLNLDGTLDSGFNPGAGGVTYPKVFSFVVQADGKILVGGLFSTLGGQPRENLGRLNADGTLDESFNPGARSNDGVYSLAVQPDGKILVGGGYFFALGGQPRIYYIGRLNADGTLDTSFNPGANNGVRSLAVQADGKILVGGLFTTLGGQPRTNIARLNTDGTLDTGFNPGAAVAGLPEVHSLALQADGRIVVGGYFTTLGGQTRNYIGRLNADGTLDSEFNPGASGSVLSLAVQADGKIVVGGYFTTLGGEARNNIGRLNSTEPATQSLNYAGSNITWLRGGTSPEVWRTTFDHSTNGSDWISLGVGERIAGGWQLSGVSLPSTGNLRARGYVAGGRYNASGWFVETYSGAPLFVEQPTSRTNDPGTTATFRTTAAGSEPLNFQWLKKGVPLVDGGNISGVTTPTLTLSNVLGADGAAYRVAVSNAQGSVTSQVATLTVIDPLITGQPVSQTKDPGQSVTFSVTAVGTAPLTYQWRKEGVAAPQATGLSLTLTNLQAADAGYYSVVVSNMYGSRTSAVVELSVNLSQLDSGFNPGVGGDSYSSVSSLAVQPGGKILVGGSFTTLGWQPRIGIGRLNADGTLDTSFNPGVGHLPDYSPSVSSLAVQADEKILVGGSFTTLGGQPRTNIARLNADGTLDSGFNPGAKGQSVSSLAVQADGRILVGGYLWELGGQPRNNLGRLNADGTLDSAFNPGVNGSVYSLVVQADGKILVGGKFTTLGGQSRTNIGRLNPDGTLDNGFNPGAGGFASSEVYSLTVQADGTILVGGYFTTLGGQPCNNMGRLNADGTLDSGFNLEANDAVFSLAAQADGKILLCGRFTMLGGQPRNGLGRLNADGTLDSGFNPGAGDTYPIVLSLAVQADGKILVGGQFTKLGGQPRNYLGRLNNTGPATQSLGYAGSTTTWLRGGTSPEVWRTTFDHSTNGSDWISLGVGERIPGGWQLTNVSLPGGSTLRARGLVTGGFGNASGWFVETLFGSLVLVTQPASRTNDAGTTATFSATAGGNEPLSFHWLKNGVALVNVGNISGVTTPTLTLSNVLGADGGAYRLVVTNAQGSVTSQVATLTVMDPLITSQPVNQSKDMGQSVTFSVSAAGTAPLTYQWWKEGVTVSQATGPSLTLTNLQGADAGNYTVVVSNRYGSVTSAVALLTVNLATLDIEFNPGAAGNYPSVYSLAVQADGKILVGGGFTTLGGQVRTNIGRLNADGTVDVSFSPGVRPWGEASSQVNCLAIQPDGRILVGGLNLSSDIGRLNADGSVDLSFHPYANSYVSALALQADGKILVGGHFTALDGLSRRQFGRLNTTGEPDALDPSLGEVFCLTVQPDGKILIGGDIVMLDGQSRSHIGRLNANGGVDTGFNPGADGTVFCLAVQVDGKILVGGWFTTLGGQTRNGIGRLNADGTLDTSFNPAASGEVGSLALQADGKILVGGSFTTLGGQPRNNLGRLNADGTLDSGFNPGANGSVSSLAVQADGKILVGGGFTTLGGKTRNRVGRLNNTGPATQSLGYAGSTITWLRGGTSPEVWRTTFDHSTNGTDWTSLGVGERIPGGWQLTNVSLPPNGTLRARGHVTGGENNWFVESYNGALLLITQPTSRTNEAGTTATFSVAAGGTEPLSYQWRFYGTNLAGQTSASLVLPGVTTNQAGPYAVVVTNASGSVTSAVATLTVVPVLTLGEALDAPQLAWTSGGNAPWTAQTSVTHDGVDAAQSGAISHSQETWVETSVVGPGPLSFWWKVSSESGCDYLEFYTNSVRATQIAGEVNWQVQNYTLGTGTQVLRWRYMKDGSANSGQDRGWVDQVSFAPPSGPPVILVNDGSFGVRTNRFGFNLSGTAGQVVIVESSTNLANWLPFQTNTLGSGPFYFSDPATGAFPWRFYRARVGP